MKPISKKIAESGLVPKHTLLLMQRWGYLDPEEPLTTEAEVIQEEIREGFAQFVEELDTLIEAKDEEEMKETKFSITLQDPFRVTWLSEKYGNWSAYGDFIVVFRDEAERMIFPSSESPHIGMRFEVLLDKSWYEVTECTPLWSGDTIVAYQVEAEQLR